MIEVNDWELDQLNNSIVILDKKGEEITSYDLDYVVDVFLEEEGYLND